MIEKFYGKWKAFASPENFPLAMQIKSFEIHLFDAKQRQKIGR